MCQRVPPYSPTDRLVSASQFRGGGRCCSRRASTQHSTEEEGKRGRRPRGRRHLVGGGLYFGGNSVALAHAAKVVAN
jgi:hypothetical protein